MNKKIAFIGGDRRQTEAIAILAENHEVAAMGFDEYRGSLGLATRCDNVRDAVKGSSAVILPLPYTRDRLHVFAPLHQGEILVEDVLSSLEPDSRLLGGVLDDYILCRVRQAVDYYKSEELQIMNAVPTAEGAIAIAMNELDITLFGAKATVIGFGRIGRLLACRLGALGCVVTVCARSEADRAYARAYGYGSANIDGIAELLRQSDVVFNTVPAHIITPEMYPDVKEGIPIIDLASRPGGIDFERAKQYGLNVIWALSLPGKAAPVTAGRIIASALGSLMKELDII